MAKPTTRGVGQTFASFSLQVKWLMIASEQKENELKLKRTAEIVRVLSSQIVNMVERVIADVKKEDVSVQVIRCCERVCATAESLVVASQMVDISGSGFSRSGSLVGQVTVLHEATVELLRLASDVEAVSVIRCSRRIHPALNSLLSARDLNHLEELVMVQTCKLYQLMKNKQANKQIESYSEAVSCFEDDISKRNVLLCEAVDFEAVNQSIDALKKSVPLLSASMKTLLMYPQIKDAQVSKNNVVGLVLSSLDSLSKTLRRTNQNWPLTDSSLKVRQFNAVCKELVNNLKETTIATTNSKSSVDLTNYNYLDVQLNHIVQYAMDFASLAGKASKTNILKTCSMLLENHEKISQPSQSSSHSVLHDGKYSVSVSAELNRSLIDSVSQLQGEVVNTLPNFVTSIIIKDRAKPVFNLLKAVKERSHSNESLLEAEERVKSRGSRVLFCADQFRAELKDFCISMRLAVAGSTASLTDVEEIQKHVSAAEKLGNKILMNTEELSHDDDLDSCESPHVVGDLETEVKEWCIGAEKVLENADKLVSTEVLLMLCGERIWKTVSRHSHVLSVSKDEEALDDSVVSMTQRFLRLSSKVNDKHLDAWLKNGLRRKIVALDRVLNELKSTNGLKRSLGTGSDSARFYRSLQQSISDICWCVKTGRLTDDRHEESLSVVRVAFDCLIDNAMTENNSTGLMECEVEFDLLTSLGLHGSALCEIKEIMNCLIFDAVSGAAEEEVVRSRHLLFTSNHILHSVLLLMDSVEQKDQKRSFIFNKLAQLTDLVPMVLDEADNVRSFKQSDLQPLYELGEKLCHTMSLLINFVDDVLLRWNPLPQNLITSAMAFKWPLLMKETEELNCLMVAVLDLISVAKKEAVDFDDEDFRTITKTDSLKEFLEEIESLSYRILSSTTEMNSSDWSAGKSDFVRELRVLLRDWSTRVYFLSTRLDRLSVRYLDGDHTWKERVLWMRLENDRLRSEMRCGSEGKNETVEMLDDLSFICDLMDDLVRRSDHLFSSQKLALLLAQWSSKVRRLENCWKDRRISSSGSGQPSSSMEESSSSFVNEEIEETQLDGKKRSTVDDGPASTEEVPRITGDENTFKQTKQKDWYEKFIADRSATDNLPTSDKKISPDAQSPIIGSPKTVKKQVAPVQRTRRFFGYKIDERAPATSGSIVDCIHEMSTAAYQLKEHLQNQRENFENKRENKDRVTELLNTIRKKEEKVVHVANVLINHCNDERIGDDMRFALQHVQSILSQLYILISVKMAIDDTHTEDKNLKTSIQRLLDSLNNLKCGFEAVCVKGLTQSSSESVDYREVGAMARWWKINWIKSQSLNSLRADKDELGLRASKNYLPPQPL